MNAICWKLTPSRRFYRRLYGGVQVFAPNNTNLGKISRLCGTISSLAFNASPFLNLASFLILSRSFQQCEWIFADQPLSKLVNTLEGSIHCYAVSQTQLMIRYSWATNFMSNDHSIASGCQNATLKKFEFLITFVLIYFLW